MRKLKDALRLKFEAGQSHQQIAAALGISKGVVIKCVGLAVAAGLDWQAIAAMDEATLERRLLASPRPSDTYAQADYGRIHQELGRKGVTLMLLWEEYCAQAGDEHSADNPVKPWRYSQFCENYRQFAKRLKRSMRQIHRAGEKLFIDYAGPTLALVVNGQEVGRANIFVAAMGVSGYCFCLATPAQKVVDWLGATAQALAFYGGVPKLIVPDNPRALVTVAERYEPVLTQTVQDFARHYGCSVLPARAYHPQDKPKVELSVLLVERWILARLRKFQFTSVQEVNDAIAPLLHWLNQRAFQKLPGSRASVFAQIDAPALMALPEQPWEWAVFKTVRVHIDSHVEFEGHRYSVPNALVGLALELRVKAGHAVLITGATGAGKSWLACALAQHACRRGHSALYLRVPRLGEELRIRHANGTFTRWLDTLKNTDVLVLDDWGMAAMDSQTRVDLLEIIDDRAGHRATIITSQLPIEHWHEWIGDQTMADAMLDRLTQNHHRFTLTGESLRKKSQPIKESADN